MPLFCFVWYSHMKMRIPPGPLGPAPHAVWTTNRLADFPIRITTTQKRGTNQSYRLTGTIWQVAISSRLVRSRALFSHATRWQEPCFDVSFQPIAGWPVMWKRVIYRTSQGNWLSKFRDGEFEKTSTNSPKKDMLVFRSPPSESSFPLRLQEQYFIFI